MKIKVSYVQARRFVDFHTLDPEQLQKNKIFSCQRKKSVLEWQTKAKKETIAYAVTLRQEEASPTESALTEAVSRRTFRSRQAELEQACTGRTVICQKRGKFHEFSTRVVPRVRNENIDTRPGEASGFAEAGFQYRKIYF